METNEEGVFTIYKNKELVAIVKRDDITKKHLVYMVKSGDSADIVGLIKGGAENIGE